VESTSKPNVNCIQVIDLSFLIALALGNGMYDSAFLRPEMDARRNPILSGFPIPDPCI
jgi:hypothetical protein